MLKRQKERTWVDICACKPPPDVLPPMKTAQHRLVGYDRESELEKFEVAIPRHFFGEVRTVVTFDDDDPDAIGCYELTEGQAHRIATMVHESLPAGLDFFLEAYAPQRQRFVP